MSQVRHLKQPSHLGFFQALPALTTIVFIVLSTATLTPWVFYRRQAALPFLAASLPSFLGLDLKKRREV
jgi:hypothetical protein